MSVSARTVVRSERAPATFFLGLDVHKESVTIAVLPSDAAAPTHVNTRSYDLKTLRRYLEGTAWRQPQYEWLRRLARADSSLTAEDRIVFGDYLALLEYRLSRQDELDRQIAALALTPPLAPKVSRLQCFRGPGSASGVARRTTASAARHCERKNHEPTSPHWGKRQHASDTLLPGIVMVSNLRKFLWTIALVQGLGMAGCKGDASPGGPVQPPPPVVALAPTAAFTAATTANALEPVTFDATASTSTDGSALQYVWDFGNGQRGGGKIIARSFGAAGARSVTLTVFDGANRSGSASKTVTVAPVPAAVSTVTAQGVVKALDGTAITGVLITQVGGAASVSTDTAGKASVSLGTGSPLTLKFTKAGYADQLLNLKLPGTSGGDAYFEVVMRARDAALTLSDAAAGGTLTGRDGALLLLPANALVNGAGAAVTGSVQISITPVDVTQSTAGGFPGGFDGLLQTGAPTPIVSFGTTEYVLSAAGQSVQLAAGKSATIELPLYAIKKLNGALLAAGDTTPLWSLDESTGMWIQEGKGSVVESASSPSGLALRATVTHFSWWNSDIGFDPYGPRPKCVYDTDSGIPGGNDTFATATICNMLAEIDNGLPPAPRVIAGATRSAAAATPRFAGFARRLSVPIAGGVTMAVPANVNISLKATALNGTWGGSVVVNGAVGVQAEHIIRMRPLFAIAGPTPEAITLPFDGSQPRGTAAVCAVHVRWFRTEIRARCGFASERFSTHRPRAPAARHHRSGHGDDRERLGADPRSAASECHLFS